MLILSFLISSILSVTGVTVIEPVHCAAYNLDELPGIRAIVENDNVLPDSVLYSLNGGAVVQIPRLNTDWPTYMQNYIHHGYSESPAPTDNTILWTAPVTGPTHEFPTPVVVDGIIYYPSNSGTDSLYALEAATGELIWKYEVGYTDDAVSVEGGFLYIASDSIFCLDALTGERIWASGDADWDGSTPVVVEEKVYCGTASYSSSQPKVSYISCLAASDGSNIWTTVLDNCCLISCMTVWNQHVFIPTWLMNDVAALYALDAETGAILWENNDSFEGYWDSSPVVVDSVIYINGCDGIARGIDAISGNTIWESSVGYASATPAYHDGRLFFASDDENPSYYCLDALSGASIWTTPASQHGSSAIADGIVFYGDNSNLPEYGSIVALDCETGGEVWSYSADSSIWIAGSPSITDGVVYMPMHDWNLYAFGTGLKYTYHEQSLNSQVGWNELIATSFDNGIAVASDTISFYINPTGIKFKPSRQLLLAGSPNPFSSCTTLSFSLGEPGLTSIEIYDLAGRSISTLVECNLPEGNHSVKWDGTDHHGGDVSAGLYLCRIQSGGVVETTGLCLLR